MHLSLSGGRVFFLPAFEKEAGSVILRLLCKLQFFFMSSFTVKWNMALGLSLKQQFEALE